MSHVEWLLRSSRRRELRPVIEDAIDALSPAFRAVFVLRAVEEMSTAEVAATLGIPEDSEDAAVPRSGDVAEDDDRPARRFRARGVPSRATALRPGRRARAR
ncbi:MAG: hypothetical protein JOZ69_17470 [Myxococcales bacterium]|nr:hypothetical protein [Myxococcales bacterium]